MSNDTGLSPLFCCQLACSGRLFACLICSRCRVRNEHTIYHCCTERLLIDSTAKQLSIFSTLQIFVCYLGCTADKHQLLSTIDTSLLLFFLYSCPNNDTFRSRAQLVACKLRELRVKSGHSQAHDAAELTGCSGADKW